MGKGAWVKILLVHNAYQQPGGEDEVVRTEGRLLEERGHALVQFTRHNDEIERMSGVSVAGATLWNRATRLDLARLLKRERPDLVHCHNTFPLISPSAYYAARDAGTPVVQTLHNYRLVCSNAQLFRDGGPCEDCIGKSLPWPGVLHACYRDDRRASAVVVAMLGLHRALGTWSRLVGRYIALTEFARRKFVEGGLPADRIAVKPNFLHPDPGPGRGDGGFALFVGRLSVEKGIQPLLRAWEGIDDVPLRIVGDGPLAPLVREADAGAGHVRWLGRLPQEEVQRLLGEARCLVVPSRWYEGFPRVVVEAFARGTPVVASRLGGLAEIVDEGRTGRLFRPDDAEDLARAVRSIVAGDGALRAAVRAEFEARYTAEASYRTLMRIYAEAREG
jgi:glycosyltransferase involved in cell wall biosynthesis